MQPVIVDLLVTYASIIFTPRESRVVRWIQPVVLPNPCLVCWLCAGASQSAVGYGDLHALRTQTSGLLQATVDSPLITEPGDILAGGFARLT